MVNREFDQIDRIGAADVTSLNGRDAASMTIFDPKTGQLVVIDTKPGR
jgi:hypothetical protein